MLVDRYRPAMRDALAPPPADPRNASLFFDFDGTLVDIADRPDAVVVPATLLQRLDRLAIAFPGRTAIVSGRSLDQLDRFLGEAGGRHALAGSHGVEVRPAGAPASAIARPASLAGVDAAFADFAAANGLVFERKALGAALHYRQRPDCAAAAAALAERLAEAHGLVVQRGKMMVELRVAGDKGDAIRTLLRTPAMAGTQPWMFGDDLTDEDGFVAAAEAGGAGVLVGEARETAAQHRLPDVAALAAWIDRVLEAA